MERRTRTFNTFCKGRTLSLQNKEKRQAERLSEKLASYSIDRVYASDLLRAQETLQPFKEKNPDIEIVNTSALREWNVGVLAGKPTNILETISENIQEYVPEDGESLQQVGNRIEQFTLQLLDKHQEECIAFYSHGTALFMLTSRLLKLPFSAYPDWVLKNAELLILEIKDGKVTCVEKG
jgi:broad specificity phosphatase PhoE